MLEEDYLAQKSNEGSTRHGLGNISAKDIEQLSDEAKETIREILIPEIEREVNEGKNFAVLRQIFNSMILATWYKKNLKESLLGKVYMDTNKTTGIDLDDKNIAEKIYNQYVEAFKLGVYDYIKEEYDPASQEIISHKYFSGGVEGVDAAMLVEDDNLAARIPVTNRFADAGAEYQVTVDLRNANGSVISSLPDAAMLAKQFNETYQVLLNPQRERAIDLILNGSPYDVDAQELRGFLESDDSVLVRVGLFLLEQIPELFTASINELLVKRRDTETNYGVRNAIIETYKNLGIDGTESFAVTRTLKQYWQKWKDLNLRQKLLPSENQSPELKRLQEISGLLQEKSPLDQEYLDAIVKLGMLKGPVESPLKQEALRILNGLKSPYLAYAQKHIDQARQNILENTDEFDMITSTQPYLATAYPAELNGKLEAISQISADLMKGWGDRFIGLVLVGSASKGYWIPTAESDFDVVILGTDPGIEYDFNRRARGFNIDGHSLVAGNDR
ncbi:hypothetical protein, partial [Nitrosomonas sp.]|uniref:hypothetical protein n=1 Tax=Nitrosomonas sp. TaxID=42353 RepID=UPI001DA3BCAB